MSVGGEGGSRNGEESLIFFEAATGEFMELVSDLICASTVSRGIVAGWCRENARVRRVASGSKESLYLFEVLGDRIRKRWYMCGE